MIKDSIAVLCRGESLKHIDLLPDVEEYLIINGFSDELEMDFIKEKLTDKKILLIVTGGIACYKALDLIRRLQDKGSQVELILTSNAQEFVKIITLILN